MKEPKPPQTLSATAATVPFPVNYVQRNPDRSFKQVVVPGEDGSYRIQTINANQQVASTVYMKRVATSQASPGISIDHDKYRVKAILKNPVLGIQESYWLTMDHQDYTPAQLMNQYRIRGVAKNHRLSDWVYSELRDDTNKQHIFELLHEIIDLIDLAQDDQLDILLQSFVTDTFQSTFTSGDPKLAKYLAENEDVLHRIQEAFSFIDDQLKTVFRETILASPQEFVDFMKTFQEFDAVPLAPFESMFTLIVEHFLDEKLEQIVQASNIEAILRNDENIWASLSSEYDLNVQEEIIRSAYSIMPEDNFVVMINSVVKFIIDPVVYESFNVQLAEQTTHSLRTMAQFIREELETAPSEEFEVLFKSLLKEAYVPILMLDQRLLQLNTDMQDSTELAYLDDVQLATYADALTHHFLLKDLMAIITRSDGLIVSQLSIELADRLFNHVGERVHALVSYELADVFMILLGIGEQVAISSQSTRMGASDELRITQQESVRQDASALVPVSDTLQAAIIDSLEQQLLMGPILTKDELRVAVNDSSSLISDAVRQIADYLSLSVIDNTTYQFAPHLQSAEIEMLNLRYAYSFEPVYKLHPKDPMHSYLMDHKEQLIEPNLLDRYEMVGREEVNYALGDVGSGWPLGEFVLGTNTLKG